MSGRCYLNVKIKLATSYLQWFVLNIDVYGKSVTGENEKY